MNHTLILIFFFLSSHAFSQKDSSVIVPINDTLKKFVYYSKEENKSEGYFVRKNDSWVVHGKNNVFFKNGIIQSEKQYYYGVPFGIWKSYDLKGNLVELRSVFSDSIAFVTTFYPNGHVSSIGELNNGKEIGIWRYYYENGTLKETGFWAQIDVPTDPHEYYTLITKYGVVSLAGKIMAIKKDIWLYLDEKGETKSIDHNMVLFGK